MNKQLGVCIVGSGAMGRIHARIWQELAETTVVRSMVDADQALAQEAATEFNVPHLFTDYRAAVVQPNVDIVSICVPTVLHPEITILAAQHGKHVLCEKPIALTIEAAQSMIDATNAAGVKLAVGLMRRYSPVMTILSDFLSDKRAPVIYRAESAVAIRPKRAMHNQHANGGPYIDMLCHFIDTGRVIFQSEPKTVMAQGMILAQHRPEIVHIANKAIDSGSFSVQYESDDIVCGLISWGLPPASPPSAPLREHIFGAHGVLDISFVREQGVVLYAEDGQTTTLLSSTVNNYDLELAAFVQSVLHDAPIRSTGEDGLASLRVSLALLESIKTSQTIQL